MTPDIDFVCYGLVATVTFSLEIRDQLGVEWPRPKLATVNARIN